MVKFESKKKADVEAFHSFLRLETIFSEVFWMLHTIQLWNEREFRQLLFCSMLLRHLQESHSPNNKWEPKVQMWPSSHGFAHFSATRPYSGVKYSLKGKNSVSANLFSLRNIAVEWEQRWKLHLRHVRYNISLPSYIQNDSPNYSLIILILLCLHIGCWQVHFILPYSSASEKNCICPAFTVCQKDVIVHMVVLEASVLTGNLLHDVSWVYVYFLLQNAGRTRNIIGTT